ncbi:hypothetical protein DTK66_07090 [Lactobacillus sp. M31]|uniref:Uncharacterized protein n=1 Tax=Limosilactobacillus walteri TaxID=2268022 RepID=A0ABR8P847_9LACO|nr:hypothetical protein [Limosilactobacillus walteri]
MDKQDCFNLGFQTCVLSGMLFVLLFGEVTLWPMKKPLHEHLLLYPIALMFVILGLVHIIQQM